MRALLHPASAAPAPAARRLALPRPDLLVDATLLLAGSWLHVASYGHLQPLAVAAIFATAAALALKLLRLDGPFERLILRRLFCVGWLAAAVSALYVNQLEDPMQLTSDAGTFYQLATGESAGLSLDEIRTLTTGAGAVMLWRAIYDGIASLGLDKARYIGLLINIVAVGFAGVLSVRMARALHGDDARRLRRLVLMFSLCGLFWLFSAIHLRDAVVLLAVTATCYPWVVYLVQPGLRHLLILLAANSALFVVFFFLRAEFVFVPVAMFLAGAAALILTQRPRRSRRALLYTLYALMLLFAIGLFVQFQEQAFAVLARGQENYLEQTAEQAGAGSLGMTLIVNQPLPVRLVLGMAYLFVFPIPFWSGLQFETAAPLFKSLNVLFFYALTPLALLGLLRVLRRRAMRTPANVFLVFIALGFTLAIAGTSLETRHFGAFLVPVFLIALLPDLHAAADRRAYRALLGVLLALMAAVHLAWIALKLV